MGRKRKVRVLCKGFCWSLVTQAYGYWTSHRYCQEVYTCWIFLGSHLNRVLHSFLLFTFDFVKFLMMAFLSRLKFRGWDRCVEKALFPLAEWFRTSKKRFSCCLKSYSTLDRQTDRQTAEKWIKPPQNTGMTQRRTYKIQLLPNNANGCLGVSDLHDSLFFYYASSFFSYSDALHVGNSVLVRFQSAWLVSAGRYSPAGYLSFFFFLSEGAHVLFEHPYLPLGL